MGSCGSKSLEQQRNKQIENELEKDQKVKVSKVLLLGAGECGKSTILKQMRLLHDKFNENDMLFYKPIIASHIVISMVTVIDAMPTFAISFEDIDREEDVQTLRKIIIDEQKEHPVDPELCQTIKRLWSDLGIKKAYEHRDEVHIPNSAKYFFDEIDRISKSDYQPTIQDILNVRLATMGIQEVRFWSKATQFRVFDVGGQKSQRKKWIHVFDDVNAVLFITAVSEFNQMMKEDSNTNRLLDSLALFAEVSNSQYFKDTAMILFFNKTDLFQEKTDQNLSIKSAFPDYEGPIEYRESLDFIKGKFKESVTNKTKKLHIHETCANDTNQVQVVLVGVTDVIKKKAMKSIGV